MQTKRPTLALTWDAATDVAYLEVTPTGPGDVLGPTLLLETDPQFAGVVAADFRAGDGRLVGLEFQRASAALPAAWLAGAERIDGLHLARRVAARVGPRARALPAGRRSGHH